MSESVIEFNGILGGKLFPKSIGFRAYTGIVISVIRSVYFMFQCNFKIIIHFFILEYEFFERVKKFR